MSKEDVVHMRGKPCGTYYKNPYHAIMSDDVLKVTCKNCKNTLVYEKAVTKLIENENERESKMENNYIKCQDKWIKENDIKIYDSVKILRIAESYEDGWESQWLANMYGCIGLVGTIVKFDSCFGIRVETRDTTFLYPYFVLEKIAEEKPVIAPLSSNSVKDTEPVTIDVFALLEKICGEDWVHTILDNDENGYLIISEAPFMGKPYFNLHVVDFDRTRMSTIILDGVLACTKLKDTLNRVLGEV
jgi:hypothetical protein